jgi:hypothetical protein
MSVDCDDALTGRRRNASGRHGENKPRPAAPHDDHGAGVPLDALQGS